MNVWIQRSETSLPLEYPDIENAYTKGQMYCVLFVKNGQRVVHKYPLCSLFRVVEDYPDSKK